MGLGTPDQSPLPGGPQQRHKRHRTEQALEWRFISQEQQETTEFLVSCFFIDSHFFIAFIYLLFGWGEGCDS